MGFFLYLIREKINPPFCDRDGTFCSTAMDGLSASV